MVSSPLYGTLSLRRRTKKLISFLFYGRMFQLKMIKTLINCMTLNKFTDETSLTSPLKTKAPFRKTTNSKQPRCSHPYKRLIQPITTLNPILYLVLEKDRLFLHISEKVAPISQTSALPVTRHGN